MIKEAIEKICQLKEQADSEMHLLIEDRRYTTKTYSPLKPPVQAEITINTLTGLVDYYEWEINNEDVMIHVLDHNEVRIMGKVCDPWKNRITYAKAVFTAPKGFRPSQYMEIDEAIIGIQSLFMETPEQKELINSIAKIQRSSVVRAEDDGTAQKVTIQNEIGRLDSKVIKPIWNLVPYRTFPEAAQPASKYLLRFAGGDKDSLPLVSLHESDGGFWKHQAIASIAEWLRENERLQKLNAIVIA